MALVRQPQPSAVIPFLQDQASKYGINPTIETPGYFGEIYKTPEGVVTEKPVVVEQPPKKMVLGLSPGIIALIVGIITLIVIFPDLRKDLKFG